MLVPKEKTRKKKKTAKDEKRRVRTGKRNSGTLSTTIPRFLSGFD
jgi:hypothetical protein